MISPDAVSNSTSIHERVEKYLKARQGHHFYFSADHQHLFFLKDVENTSLLHHLRLNQSVDLQSAEKISDEDFSQRTFSIVDFDHEAMQLTVSMDEKNTEMVNLHLFDLTTQNWIQLSRGKSVNSFRWSQNRQKFFYIDRRFVAWGLFESDFHVVDMKSMQDRILLNDQKWVYRIGWGGFRFDQEEQTVFFQTDENCRREKFNMVEFPLATLLSSVSALLPVEPPKMLPDSIELGTPYLLNDPFGDQLIFASSHSGFDNFYLFNRKSQELKALTQERWRNVSISSLSDRHHQLALLTSPLYATNETQLVLLNFRDLSVIRKVFQGNASATDGQDALVILEGAIDQPPRYHILNTQLEVEKTISCFIGDTKRLVNGTYEIVHYTSFDGLEIHAKLILPKKPLRAAMVLAFYGGENNYSYATELYLEEGIAILSPAVRGSWGWGQEWEDHLKNDLGGKEILDVIWGARFLEKRLQLPSSRIGVFGGSHGGYATLRAMTMPPMYQGVDTSFPFAFGICECGFADLEEFYKTSRIADWLVDLLGPFQSKIYQERSPIHFFEHLRGPLFVRHGTNDSRVPLSTMSGFIEKLKQSPYHYDVLIQQDQGHHAQNWSVIVDEKERVFQFLKQINIIE